MPLQATSGAASYDAFGGGAAAVPNYIEEVFSTYLYKGNGSTQTIINDINLSGKGGLVWVKNRSAVDNNFLVSSNATNTYLLSNATNGAGGGGFTFNSNGFYDAGEQQINGNNYVSWTFRKQPKFFDVVTWTGNTTSTAGTVYRQLSHSLASTVGTIIVKRTSSTGSWPVYHRSLPTSGDAGGYLFLNTTDGLNYTSGYFPTAGYVGSNSVTSTYNSSVFTVGEDINQTGSTYVAYLFAHDAGGFGLTGTDNVISCGSFTSDSNGRADVNLGYEPQFVITKITNTTGNWETTDVMRGLVAKTSIDNTGSANVLFPNLTNAETADADNISVTSTGFYIKGAGISNTYIYIAIRRGPMKVPTDATKVFGLSARTGTGANATVTGGQTDDAILVKNRGSAVASLFSSRLTGTNYLVTSSTAAQVAAGTTILQANPWDVMDGVKVGTTSTITNASSNTYINYLFKRAPSFMDVVCYTGTGANSTVTHNLQAVPELIICKRRDSTGAWDSYSSALANTEYVVLNTTAAKATGATRWNSTTPTSSVFSVGTSTTTNASAGTYVAYLFATCAGVSKVGSYTGTGTTLQIDCGFTAGARFVLIKRTDGPLGDWFVWDTARGIVSGNDPYLLLNSTDSEVTSTDYIDTYSAGFEISSTAPDALNINGGTFIFLAIA